VAIQPVRSFFKAQVFVSFGAAPGRQILAHTAGP
jgi:hypothetical protein